MSEQKKQEKNFEHEWKPLGTKRHEAILELICVRCGAKKEIEFFP